MYSAINSKINNNHTVISDPELAAYIKEQNQEVSDIRDKRKGKKQHNNENEAKEYIMR